MLRKQTFRVYLRYDGTDAAHACGFTLLVTTVCEILAPMSSYFGERSTSGETLGDDAIKAIIESMNNENISNIGQYRDIEDHFDPVLLERILSESSTINKNTQKEDTLTRSERTETKEEIQRYPAFEREHSPPLLTTLIKSRQITSAANDLRGYKLSSNVSTLPCMESSHRLINKCDPGEPITSFKHSTQTMEGQSTIYLQRGEKESCYTDKLHNYSYPSGKYIREPIEYYKEYFDDDFFEHISICTDRYYMRKHNKELKTTKFEIMKLIGIQILMGSFRYPRVPMYWRNDLSFEKICSKMARDRFLTLRDALHVVGANFQPPEEDNPNPLGEVRPLIDQVRNGCRKQERVPGYYSVDEQAIYFTERRALRRKSENIGLKNFILATSEGLIIDFEICTGAKTMIDETSQSFGPSVVLRLAKGLPAGSCLFHGRYFTSIPLLAELDKRGLHSTGIIALDRIPDTVSIKFKKSIHMKRGDSQEIIDGPVVLVKYMDHAAVTLASNCTGSVQYNIKRWDENKRNTVGVVPNVIKNYNKHIRGVKVLNQQMEKCRSFIKTNNGTLKVLMYFFDLALTNAYRAYEKDCKANSNFINKALNLLDFRLEIAELLTNIPEKRKYCVVSNKDFLKLDIPKKFKKAIKPSSYLRFDCYDHFPQFDDIKSPRTCVNENCKSRTKVRCIKCNAYLCIARNKNCFKNFHTKHEQTKEM